MTASPETTAEQAPDPAAIRARLARAASAHVPFDGWGEATFRAAVAETGIDPDLARAACPRGAVDLAVELHRLGDARMAERARKADLSHLRYGQKVAALVRIRIEEAGDPEVVRRSAALFALPIHAAEGATLIWHTADLIWTLLGDTSRDINWYSKRAILSGVYAATLLYWLGDDSPGHSATWEFLDRRIADVLRFEKAKAGLRGNPLVAELMRGPGRLLNRITAPTARPRDDLPGCIHPETGPTEAQR